jgi:tetratricopeptide (TPR) repeat protein
MELSFSLPYKVKTVQKNNNLDMFNFSVLLLTRNNQDTLQALMESLSQYKNNYGDICVLDLGSTDETVNIIKSFDCKFEDGSNFIRQIDTDMAFAINNKLKNPDDPNEIISVGDVYVDLSGAKSYLQSMAEYNFVLMLDGDAQIVNFNYDAIKNHILTGFNRMDFTIYNKQNRNCFLYNKNEFRWANLVYEKLIPCGIEQIGFLSQVELTVNFTKELVDEKEIYNSLIVDCFINGDDFILKTNLSELLFNKEFYHTAFCFYEKRLNNCTSDFEKSSLYCKIAEIFMKTGRENEGVEHYHKAYVSCGDWRTPLYRLGEHYYVKQSWKRCITYLEGCLHIPKPEFDTKENPFYYQDGPYSMLYIAYWWDDKIDMGKYYFDKALEINPYNQLYIDEAIYHYEYKGNTIPGYLTFQNLQDFYNYSKKYKSVLEIYPENARGTHALVAGCSGMVTVITKQIESNEFIRQAENPGNLVVLNMTAGEALENFKDQKFDMVVIHKYYDELSNDINPYTYLIDWDKYTNKLLCGANYEENKEKISGLYGEVSFTSNNFWFSELSDLEKLVIYKRKEFLI